MTSERRTSSSFTLLTSSLIAPRMLRARTHVSRAHQARDHNERASSFSTGTPTWRPTTWTLMSGDCRIIRPSHSSGADYRVHTPLYSGGQGAKPRNENESTSLSGCARPLLYTRLSPSCLARGVSRPFAGNPQTTSTSATARIEGFSQEHLYPRPSSSWYAELSWPNREQWQAGQSP